MDVGPRVDAGVVEAVEAMHFTIVSLHDVEVAGQGHFCAVGGAPVASGAKRVGVVVGVAAGRNVVHVPMPVRVVEIVIAGVLVPTGHVDRLTALTGQDAAGDDGVHAVRGRWRDFLDVIVPEKHRALQGVNPVAPAARPGFRVGSKERQFVGQLWFHVPGENHQRRFLLERSSRFAHRRQILLSCDFRCVCLNLRSPFNLNVGDVLTVDLVSVTALVEMDNQVATKNAETLMKLCQTHVVEAQGIPLRFLHREFLFRIPNPVEPGEIVHHHYGVVFVVFLAARRQPFSTGVRPPFPQIRPANHKRVAESRMPLDLHPGFFSQPDRTALIGRHGSNGGGFTLSRRYLLLRPGLLIGLVAVSSQLQQENQRDSDGILAFGEKF